MTSPANGPGPGLDASPSAAFRAQLLEMIGALESSGRRKCAETLAASVEAWWPEQRAWERELSRILDMHHEINNALVGVRGHAQLLLLGPAGNEPSMRDRLEVIIRESGRIEKAAQRIREIRSRIGGPDSTPGAA